MPPARSVTPDSPPLSPPPSVTGRRAADCVVVNQVEQTVQPPENSGGSATNEILVSLNCEAGVASATTPGNSLASPVGRKAAADAAAAAASASATASPEPAPAG